MGGLTQGKSCLKGSCIACLVLVTLATGVAAILAFTAWTHGRRPRQVEEVRIPRTIPPATPGEGAGAGKIVLDLSLCDLEIVPVPAGTPIEVEGHFDRSAYDLTESWEGSPETGWVWRLTFARRGPRLVFHVGEGDNRIRLEVPRDAAFTLAGSVGTGRSRIELGGTRVAEIDLSLGTGDHELRFSEPLAGPLGRVAIDGSIGELRLLELGNASPSWVTVDHTMGDVWVDLDGPWRQDAAVEVHCGLGKCRVTTPPAERVNLALEDGDVRLGVVRLPDRGEARPELPTLTLSVSGTLGDVSVER